MSRCSAAIAVALIAFACGCTGTEDRPLRQLPFAVSLEYVALPPISENSEATTPALFANTEDVTRDIAAALEGIELFTALTITDESGPPPDLRLKITFEGNDFGPGDLLAGGATLSTLAWLFGGPSSWWIDDREYPESDVKVALDFSDAGRRGLSPDIPMPLYTLDGMELDFVQRAETVSWGLSFLVPPCLDAGDPRAAGTALALQTPHFFVDNVETMLSTFPAAYLRHFSCFLTYDREQEEILIVSQERLETLTIVPNVGEPRAYQEGSPAMRQFRRDDLVDKQALFRYMTEAHPGIGSVIAVTQHYYYQIPLADVLGKDTGGLVRIRAALPEGRTPSWTVER